MAKRAPTSSCGEVSLLNLRGPLSPSSHPLLPARSSEFAVWSMRNAASTPLTTAYSLSRLCCCFDAAPSADSPGAASVDKRRLGRLSSSRNTLRFARALDRSLAPLSHPMPPSRSPSLAPSPPPQSGPGSDEQIKADFERDLEKCAWLSRDCSFEDWS